jgi:hypothetical protein
MLCSDNGGHDERHERTNQHALAPPPSICSGKDAHGRPRRDPAGTLTIINWVG